MISALDRLIPRLRPVVTAFCAYELVALYSPLPTLSVLTRRHKIPAAIVFALLTYHLWLEPRPS